ncbi:NAD-binding of NADP-dependent 3-hydroxyisobutyrate dehydrogenase [Jannaschia faecimaris]|uniref:NAD-binding of NADP-dependent 3-hydroxyisobutyrate dehydrogenase n=1 Tax=Jannaschia faecimaris TaxID=1244108 RepID=A0A1H3RBL3_9RHOB|nr:NAD-binding of NADP-dependent 3-hydroxyisobutyrate dehydrogenase [Jannaschia faecimaris]
MYRQMQPPVCLSPLCDPGTQSKPNKPTFRPSPASGSNEPYGAGLNGEAVVDVIQGGVAGSWQMVNRHKTKLAGEFEHGFAVDWMRKDLAICLAEAENVGASLMARCGNVASDRRRMHG